MSILLLAFGCMFVAVIPMMYFAIVEHEDRAADENARRAR